MIDHFTPETVEILTRAHSFLESYLGGTHGAVRDFGKLLQVHALRQRLQALEREAGAARGELLRLLRQPDASGGVRATAADVDAPSIAAAPEQETDQP